jgi:hypothetical protein
LGSVQPELTTTTTTSVLLGNGTSTPVTQTTYHYTNGSLATDVLRTTEISSDGKQTSAQGGRYTTTGTDANGNPIITGDYVSYTPGLTRYWGYNSTSQITADGAHVMLSQYTADTTGASLEGKRKLSSGVELELKRQLNPITSRVGFSLVAGVTFNSINSKQGGNVLSNLRILTDTYALAGGAAVPLPTTGTTLLAPTYDAYVQSDGSTNPTGFETTVPLDLNSVVHNPIASLGTTSVTGIWRVNGAYYGLRFGPQITARVAKDFEVSAGLGLMAAYVGTNYEADEDFTVTINGVDTSVAAHDKGTTGKFLTGYYANVDAGWEANERTGFYAGLDYQSIGSYDQKLAGRTARIDLGNTLGVRGGISIKF